ncbi:scabin-related ADP-ribosyltransferase [Filimonas effusa]|uniref:Pierisin-like domain-containing protein n=1 Tax=Filimonas effusa TaxID=2508721 RepID=A0A4Q1D9S9_9BACT|nr:RHS repeat-associated core domain-containing protein [Filimonas effusa]RXK86142.1 hypothetical protein ESB13_04850 [Filimonas effusa]
MCLKTDLLKISTAIVVLLSVCIGRVKAQPGLPVVEYVQPLTGSQLVTQAAVTVQNDLFFDPVYSAQIDQPYPVKNIVALRINESYNRLLPPGFTVTVSARIIYTNTSQVQDSITHDFTVTYDTAAHRMQDLFVFHDAQRVTVRILGIQAVNAANQVISPAPDNGYIIIENKIQVQPRYKFNCTTTVTSLVLTDSAKLNPDELYVSWNDILGAHEYDLEWTYVDSSTLASHVFGNPVNSDAVFKNNATRVSLAGSHYAIPLMYNDAGTVFVRVRAVQYNGPGRLEASWNNTVGLYAFQGHERELNWQSTISYAEGGLRKLVVQYYDGSLRSRQTVTKDNSTNTTVVAESFYDYQGRPVIQVLPAPTLNTIVSYTRQFNVALAGGEYEKGNYDTLPDISAYCGTGAAAMGTQTGAARYYSPQNPERSGNNAYIPDAEGFPFAETQYTQDGTGRISRQGGVGANYRPGEGHDTRYFYASPAQDELDALFGTEVGDQSHYFKNAVQDANGQFSVSYVDMHGRTIATALAGDKPAGMKELDSKYARHKTEQLADSNSVVLRGTTIEHKKSMFVDQEGDFVFRYDLDPEALLKSNCQQTQICYSCLYDLTITVSDDCNNQKLPGGKAYEQVLHNFSISDIQNACNTPGFHLNFTLHLVPGNYEVTKQLSISKYAKDYYQEKSFIPNNTCTTLQDIINEQRTIVLSGRECYPSCSACKQSLGEWENFRAQYMLRAGIAASDSASFRQQAWAAYKEAEEACKALCGEHTEADDLRKAMLLDLTPPSGQYADFAKRQSAYSIFYADEDADKPEPFQQTAINYFDASGQPAYVIDNRNLQLVKPNFLNREQFADKFQLSWAEALLPLHPEYCKLLKFGEYKASHEWDIDFANTDTYQDAKSKGYLNPIGNTSAFPQYATGSKPADPLAASFGSQLQNSLSVAHTITLNINGSVQSNVPFSMWATACMSVTVAGNDTAGLYKAYLYPFNETVLCSGDLDMAWRVFRNSYLQMKKQLLVTVVNAACPSGAANPTAQQLYAAGFTPNFVSAAEVASQNGLGNLLNSSSGNSAQSLVNQQLQSAYDENCRAYAKMWLKQMAPCIENGIYDQSEVENIILPRLIEVCKQGSDASHPMGASSVSPASTYEFRSFEEVLKNYNATHDIAVTFDCNPEMITSPQRYDLQPAYVNTPVYSKPSDCECSRISGYYNEFTQNHKDGESFSDYLKRTKMVSINEASLTVLRNLCNSTNTTCQYLSTPVSLPVIFQCHTAQPCVPCSTVNSLYGRFQIEYPDIVPAELETTVDQQLQNRLFANFMNNRLGLSKQAFEYLSFIGQCSCENGGKVDQIAENFKFNDIKKTRDGGTLLAGAMYNDGGYHFNTAAIAKKDAAGNLLWAHSYMIEPYSKAEQSFIQINKIKELSTGHLIAIGNAVADFNGTGGIDWWDGSRAFVMKLDKNGNWLWTKAAFTDVYFSDIIETPDGGVAFAGNTNTADASDMDWLVGKFDPNGDLVWCKQYNNDGNDEALGLVVQNNELVVTGYAESDKIVDPEKGEYPDYTMSNALIVRLSLDDGSFQDGYSYDIDGIGNRFGEIYPSGEGFKVKLYNTDAYILGLETDMTGFAQFNSDLSVVDMKALSSEFRADYMTSKMWPDKDGGLLYSIKTNTGIAPVYNYDYDLDYWYADAPEENCYVFRINPKGDVEWGRHFEKDVRYNSFTPGSNNYLAIGKQGYNPLLAEIPLNGELNCSDEATDGMAYSVQYYRYGALFNQVSDYSDFLGAEGDAWGIALTTETICHTGQCMDQLDPENAPMLCDGNEFDFSPVTEEVNNCSDTSFLIHSKATEIFKVYQDSLKNDFERLYHEKCLGAYRIESFTVERTLSEYHYTLYYYDQAGNLTKTIPPAGVNPNRDASWLAQVKAARAANNNTQLVPAHSMATVYTYNSLGQVTGQISPDGGQSAFWYDRLGRLAVSQNARQKNASQYSYTLYDQLGRITEVGQLTSADPMTSIKSRDAGTLQDWLTAASSSRTQITQTVYDIRYEGLAGAVLDAANLRNRVSYTALFNDAAAAGATNGFATATLYSYDIHGNVDTLVQYYNEGIMKTSNGSNTWKKMVYRYDLISGKVNHVAYQPGQRDAFYHRYLYDAENRLVTLETSRDSVYWENEAWYSYYKHGPLARTVLGHNQVQGLDYAYTLQGWLKAVNSGQLLSGGANGTGTGCASTTAVDDLVLNYRPAAGPAVYTARQSINFDNGFTSNDTDEFETNLDSGLPLCNAPSSSLLPDGTPGNPVAKDAFSYVLHYNAADFKPINAGAPDALVPGLLGADYRPLYNGNIAGMGVTIGKLGQSYWYNYRYDQLNRLVSMDAWKSSSDLWTSLEKQLDYKESISYDANGNISSYLRNGSTSAGKPQEMDRLAYYYNPGNNQLNYIHDTVPENNYTEDIDAQSMNNYTYDAIGNMTRDIKSGITDIQWNVYGKISHIVKSDNTTIDYAYDASGNRIRKTVGSHTTCYVRDAQGNVMSVYEAGNTALNNGNLTQTELHMYGSSRLGIIKATLDAVNGTATSAPPVSMPLLSTGNSYIFTRGYKFFELSNHLGNVLATVSDRKIPVSSNGTSIDYYNADIVSAQDYYPGGMQMLGRIYSNGVGYKYGFAGKEKDNEIKGEGNSYNFDARMYDPRVVRWFSTDAKEKPHLSPYNFVQNNFPNKIDPDGNDDIHFHFLTKITGFTLGAGTPACSTFYRTTTTAAVQIVKTNGPDRFFHHKHFVFANGMHSEKIKEFHPFVESSRSGLTTTPIPFSMGLLTRNDKDVHTLGKYYDAFPEYKKLLDQRLANPTSDFYSSGNWYNYNKVFKPAKSNYDLWGGVAKGAEITAAVVGFAEMGLSLVSAEANTARFLYRFDTRSLEEIKAAGGFKAWGDDLDIAAHATGSYESAYVSTSLEESAVMKMFQGKSGFIYKIKWQEAGVNVNEALGSRTPYGHELEIAVPGRIDAADIINVKPNK